MNTKIIATILFLLISKISLAGTMTASGNTDDYCMSRSSVPDVFNGLVFRTTMNQGTGSTVRDVSGYGADGTIYGATWVNVNGRRCLSFDGIDNYTNHGDPPDEHLDFGTGSFSYGCYVYVVSNKGNYDSPIKKGSAGVAGYAIYFGNGDWEAYLDGDINTILVGTTTPILNRWTHVFVVNDTVSNNAKFFIDGVQTGTQSIAGVGNINTSQGLRFSNTSYIFNGYIDDVRIYNRALSNAEVLQIYNATK